MAKIDPNRSRLPQPDTAAQPSSPLTALALRSAGSTLLSGLLILIVLAAFLPALRNGFVDYDDNIYITENSHVRSGLSWESIAWAFRSTEAANWHPLTWLSHILDCQIFGLRPWGHHLTSILFHATNTVLLFLILKGMTGAVWRSLFVAALFGAHPLHVESVAWVAERKDVVSTFFFLLTIGAYARYAGKSAIQKPKSEANPKCEGENAKGRSTGTPQNHTTGRTERARARQVPSSVFYLLALLFFMFGLMSKPMLVTLPFVLVLLDYWPLQRWSPASLQPSSRAPVAPVSPRLRLILEKLPFFALAIAGSAVTFIVQRSEGAMDRMAGLAFSVRAENALVSYARYLGKLFWPANLSAFYPYPDQWPWATVGFAGLLLVGVTVFVLARRRRAPYLIVGWLWFIGMLVPVIGLVQVGEQAMADRYTYIPLIGILLFLAWGAHALSLNWPHRTAALSAAGCVASLLCLVLTHRQVAYWKNSQSLFRHAIAVTENNFLALHNLAGALSKDGHFPEAIGLFETAIRLRPNDPAARNSFAFALLQQGKDDAAIAQFQEALRCATNYYRAHDNLGIAFSRQGRLDEAMLQFREALRLKPNDPIAHNNLGMALQSQGNLDEAISHLVQAVALRPDDADTHKNLGMALGRKGRLDEAISHLRLALKLNPKDAQAHNNLGIALGRQGHFDESILQFEAALRLKPDSAETHASLGTAFAQTGRRDEAIRHLNEALRLKPAYPAALQQLRALTNDAPR